MGAVLALKPWIWLFAVVTLGSCGTAADGPIVRAVLSGAKSLAGPPDVTLSMAERKAAVLRDVETAGGKTPVLLVEIPDLDAVASLLIAARNGEDITWIDPAGVSVVTRNGVVISTRGLGHDLMIADVTGASRALSGGPKTYHRVHRYLDGEGQLQRRTFNCTLTKTKDVTREECTDTATRFRNEFANDGTPLMTSTQWIGPQIGVAHLTRLR